MQHGEILAFLTTYFGCGFDSIQNSASSPKTSYDHLLRIVQDCDDVQLSVDFAVTMLKTCITLVSKNGPLTLTGLSS